MRSRSRERSRSRVISSATARTASSGGCIAPVRVRLPFDRSGSAHCLSSRQNPSAAVGRIVLTLRRLPDDVALTSCARGESSRPASAPQPAFASTTLSSQSDRLRLVLLTRQDFRGVSSQSILSEAAPAARGTWAAGGPHRSMKAWKLQTRGGIDIHGLSEASERYSTCQAGRPEDPLRVACPGRASSGAGKTTATATGLREQRIV